jgi:hypothetical protein
VPAEDGGRIQSPKRCGFFLNKQDRDNIQTQENFILVEMLSMGFVSRPEGCLPIFNSVADLLNPLDKCISCCITLDTNLTNEN